MRSPTGAPGFCKRRDPFPRDLLAIVVPTSGDAELRLYVDNALDATAAVSRPNDFDGYFAFGGGGLPFTSTATWPTSASFTGRIDNVAYYDRTLSATTMSQHWYAGRRGG